MSEDCLFCKIINGDIPSEKVYEDDEILAFKDINPVADVHVLLIPKKHISMLNDLDAEDAKVMGGITYRASELARELGVEKGYRLVANNGASAGQSVFHIHFHLLGGRNFSWPPG